MKILEKIFNVFSVIVIIGAILIGIIKYINCVKQADENINKLDYTHQDCYEYYLEHQEQY